MRLLAIDHGNRWFGLALSDPMQLIARPLEVVEGEEGVIQRIGELIVEEGIVELVVGLPLNMDGTAGPKAAQVREFIKKLENQFQLPVHEWDERLSSFEAETYLREGGLKGHQIKEKVDMVAAQILLQGFLDSRKREDS